MGITFGLSHRGGAAHAPVTRCHARHLDGITPTESRSAMPLKAAVKTSGDYLDLKELAKSAPVLCIFRIHEFCPPEPTTGYTGINVPVIADVLIVDGPRAGEVHERERLFGGITSALRGIKNPNVSKGEKPSAPLNAVGDEIVTRVKLVNPGKSNEGAVGDEPSASELAAATAFYGDGVSVWQVAAVARAEPAAVGSTKLPWS